MAKLIMFQGLPGSGKSTIARGMQAADPDNIVIVEKDIIRAELAQHGWVWSPEAEAQDVIPERDRQIGAALSAGKTAISSDTNLGRKHKGTLSALARRHGATFEQVRVDVPVDECIIRNAGRPTAVPESVIWDMYHRYIINDPGHWPLSARPASPISEEPPPEVAPDGTPLMPAILCDLDGTLAYNNGHRSHYDASTADQDDLVAPVWRLIRLYHDELSYQIIYCSGREEKDRAPTERFLDKHSCPPGPLLMRPTGDHRKDCVVKAELFDTHVRGRYRVEFVLDDRPQVLRMWRSLGIFTLACGDLREF